jgi:hypothetical protein
MAAQGAPDAIAATATSCRLAPLSEPARWATVSQPRPTLRWQPLAPGPHRLQVAVLLPESRVVAMHDVMVDGDSWTFPAPIPVERAAVKVRVSQGCPQLDAQDLHAAGPRFFMDLREGCVLDQERLRMEAGRLVWAPVPAAQAYRVRWMRPSGLPAEGWTLVQDHLLTTAAWPWPASWLAGDVITVQPNCDGRVGLPAALRWPAPP